MTTYGIEHDTPSSFGAHDPAIPNDPQTPEPRLNNENMHAEYLAFLRTGDTRAATKVQWDIALANENLIWWWARKLWHRWTPHTMSVQDLAHYGMFGMLRAIEKYHPCFETKLASYAGWWIRRSIDSAVFENGPTIRIPEYRINQKAHIDAVTLELLEQGLEPTLERIARELNTREEMRCRERPGRKRKSWTAEAVDEVNLVTLNLFSSLDQSAHGDESEEMHSYIAPARDTERPEHTHSAPFLRQGFRAIVESSGLSERNKMILELYFYGESRDKATVAQLFGITKKKFGAILGEFLEEFPVLFKLANAQDFDFLSIVRFANLPERQRTILHKHYYKQDTAAQASQDSCPPEQDDRAHALELFKKECPGLHAIVHAHPEMISHITRFARRPAEYRMMLGIFFSHDELKKQDIAVLCNVSRERVRQIIDDFSRRHRGPLSRLFMCDFESPQEICAHHVLRRFKPLEENIEAWFKDNKLAKIAPFLKMIFIERLPRKTIAKRCGGLKPGTMTNRLNRAAARLRAAPPELLPFFCHGIVNLSPREILARQMWGFLTPGKRDSFRQTLNATQQTVFDARLGLHGRQMTLRELRERLGKKHTSDVSGIIDHILHNFFETAAETVKKGE